MKILRTNLKPKWVFKTDKKVWRLLPGSGVLAAELREPDAKLTEYAAIDLSSGTPLWQGLTLEEPWWIAMNRIYRDVFLLQQFVKPDMPTTGKIFAIDLFTGKALWENHELTFLNALGDMIYGIRESLGTGSLVGLDFRTGEEKVVLAADDPRIDELSLPSPEEQFILSSFFEEIQDTLSAEHISILQKSMPGEAKSPTFIPSVFDKDIIGYYTKAGKDEKGNPLYDSHLKVIDPAGRTRFEDTVDRKVYTTLGDFYFVVGTDLIYARDSSEIVALDLEA